jgi:DNA polymerase alpha subunit B
MRPSNSYYPLYTLCAGVPMDFSLAKEALEMPPAPDFFCLLLILLPL